MVEILFTAWNRLEFTRASFSLLRENTNWSQVSRLVVYDDGSEDGTREYLAEAGMEVGVPAFELRDGGWHSTGAIMNDFVAITDTELFVKIDNDIALPPGWLDVLLDVQRRNQVYEFIGMEAGWTGKHPGKVARYEYDVTKARHIGGVGLMRTSAFGSRRPVALSLGKNGRAGFTIWQHRHRPVIGWLTPDLPVVQFDRIPVAPWADLTEHYIEAGWARRWPPYTDDMHVWWDWIPRLVTKRALAGLVRA